MSKELDIAYGTLKKHGIHILKSDIKDVKVFRGMFDQLHSPHSKTYCIKLNNGDRYEIEAETVDKYGKFDINSNIFKTKRCKQSSMRVTIDISPDCIKKLEEMLSYPILDGDLDLNTELSLSIEQLINSVYYGGYLDE